MGSESAFDDALKLKQEMDSQLTFEFQAVNVGNLADIAETRWDTLVTKPQLDLLTVSFVYFHEPIKVGGTEPISEMSYVRATWQRWDDHVWDWSQPVRQIVNDLHKNTVNPDAVFSRYAAYTVTVALDGRQRTYQAIFLFGKNPDGSENVYPIDHILGMGVLNMVTDRSLYPQPLLETYMRELPAISLWISSVGVNSDSTNRELICDPVTGDCGIPAKALKKSLEVPVDPETRKFYQSFQAGAKGKAKPAAGAEIHGLQTHRAVWESIPLQGRG
jgi:hypothetical protein